MNFTGTPNVYCKETPGLLEEWETLVNVNPALVSYITLFAAEAKYEQSDSNVIVTDVWRDDPGSLHHYWRAVDARIFNPHRDVPAREQGIIEGVGREIGLMLRDTFWYDEDHEMFVIHGKGLNRHIHFQSKSTGRWVQL